MKILSLTDKYLYFIHTTSYYRHHGERNTSELSYLALGLGGEAGESVDQVKKLVRRLGMSAPLEATAPELEKLADELGDVLWYVCGLCNVLGLSPEDLMIENSKKLYTRLIEQGHFTERQLEWPFNPRDKPEIADEQQ